MAWAHNTSRSSWHSAMLESFTSRSGPTLHRVYINNAGAQQRCATEYTALDIRRNDLRAKLNIVTVQDGGVAGKIELSVSERAQLVAAYLRPPLCEVALRANERRDGALHCEPSGYPVRGNPFYGRSSAGGSGSIVGRPNPFLPRQFQERGGKKREPTQKAGSFRQGGV